MSMTHIWKGIDSVMATIQKLSGLRLLYLQRIELSSQSKSMYT